MRNGIWLALAMAALAITGAPACPPAQAQENRADPPGIRQAAGPADARRPVPQQPALDEPDAGRSRAEALLSRTREVFGRPRRPRCGIPDDKGEIVVCAQDNTPFRTESSTAADPTSRAATRTGALAPPQLGRGSCRGKPGCMIGGRAPPPIYIFDLKSIPETPKGSDAEKVANGELADR